MKLHQIYAKVPKVPCKGLCHESCGPIPLTAREAFLAEHTEHVIHGKVDFDGEEMRLVKDRKGGLILFDWERICCPFLNAEKRCDIYEDRPLMCRLWGVTEGMPCVFGCVPEMEITDGKAGKLLKALGGPA